MRESLPIDEVLPAVIETLRNHDRVVIEAPPGAGKSTRVPAALLDADITKKHTLLLEPRRVAARAIARRIASDRGQPVGNEVGWQVRWDRRGNNDTRLWVVTEGIVTRRLLRDPYLDEVGILILDEFHERSIHTDVALGFARELTELRDDLKLVVMSATLDAGAVADFLDCEAISATGRLHPIQTSWLQKEPDHIPAAVRRAIRNLIDAPDDDGGDIVVFLPGMREIDACRAACTDAFPDIALHRLHGRLSDTEQDAALRKQPQRKVIFSTNIAETSLTIASLTAVIDTGLVRIARADPGTGFNRLETVRTSLASVKQRAGRAGRTAPGRAVRLWTQASEFRLRDFDEAEIHRIDVAGTLLDVSRWTGASPADFPWFESPSDARINAALQTLRSLGAVDDRAVCTELGELLSDMPLHPRIGRFIVEANRLGVGPLAADVAACVSEPDWVTRVSSDAPRLTSDPVARAELLRDVANGNSARARANGFVVDVHAAKSVLRVARELERYADREASSEDPATDATRALLTAFGDRIGFRASGRRYALSGGGSVVLARESPLDPPDVLLATVVFGTTRVDGVECAIVRQGAVVQEEWLPSARFHDDVDVRFDAKLDRLVARRVRRFDDLVLSESPCSLREAAHTSLELEAILAEAVAGDVARSFGLARDELRFLQRVDFLRRWMPELDLPDPHDADCALTLVSGCRSLADLRRAGFRSRYSRLLHGRQFGCVDRYAPDKIGLGGRQFRIDYSDVEQPVLAARIQDFFGKTSTPTIADGRVPLMLHLLAPNQRPAQITRDLASFWATTYAEVRKELRARYPKHRWPEDPG